MLVSLLKYSKFMRFVLFIIIFLIVVISSLGQVADEIIGSIDSIEIKKNWRTKDEIILRELNFTKGVTIYRKSLQKSIVRIWNIGNFADVNYSLDSLAPGSYLLTIIAKDALTLLPILSFRGDRNDHQLSLGVKDENFLGRNILLDFVGTIGSNQNDFNAGINLPRQLLYKNMTLHFHTSKGTGNNFLFQNNRKISGVAYHKWNISGNIGNPYHTDYHYTFSPDIRWNLFQHRTDSALINGRDIPLADNYRINYLALSVNETVGMINTIRHQKIGYSASASLGAGIGLDPNSPFYTTASFGVSYYEILKRVVQFSARFSSGYTTADRLSLIHGLGPGDIRGLLTGQETGQGYYSGVICASLTCIYHEWFALEHSVYTNFGKAGNSYLNMFRSVPRISLGTGIKIWIPMIPWLGASIHLSWLKGSRSWFNLII